MDSSFLRRSFFLSRPRTPMSIMIFLSISLAIHHYCLSSHRYCRFKSLSIVLSRDLQSERTQRLPRRQSIEHSSSLPRTRSFTLDQDRYGISIVEPIIIDCGLSMLCICYLISSPSQCGSRTEFQLVLATN